MEQGGCLVESFQDDIIHILSGFECKIVFLPVIICNRELSASNTSLLKAIPAPDPEFGRSSVVGFHTSVGFGKLIYTSDVHKKVKSIGLAFLQST